MGTLFLLQQIVDHTTMLAEFYVFMQLNVQTVAPEQVNLFHTSFGSLVNRINRPTQALNKREVTCYIPGRPFHDSEPVKQLYNSCILESFKMVSTESVTVTDIQFNFPGPIITAYYETF